MNLGFFKLANFCRAMSRLAGVELVYQDNKTKIYGFPFGTLRYKVVLDCMKSFSPYPHEIIHHATVHLFGDINKLEIILNAERDKFNILNQSTQSSQSQSKQDPLDIALHEGDGVEMSHVVKRLGL